MAETRPLRVAVIGSGLAGLTTAYLLRLKGVEVYLIEKVGRGFSLLVNNRCCNQMGQELRAF